MTVLEIVIISLWVIIGVCAWFATPRKVKDHEFIVYQIKNGEDDE